MKASRFSKILKLSTTLKWIGLLTLAAPLCPSAEAGNLPPWTLKLILGFPSAGFDLRPKEPLERSPTIKYRPAQINEIGVGAGYKWLGGTYYFQGKTAENIVQEEGTSTYTDAHLNLYGDSFAIETDYVHYTSYLIDNSTELLSASTLNGARYYRMGDISDSGAGITLYYLLSPANYSFSAALDQSEVQSKSGGSHLLLLTGVYHEYSSAAGFIPSELRPKFGVDAAFSRARIKNVAAGWGYAQNWVSGSFFCALTGALSLGWQQNTYGWDSYEAQTNTGTANIHIKLGVGWNAPGYFTGFGAYIDRHQADTGSIEIGNLVYGARLFFGIRIG